MFDFAGFQLPERIGFGGADVTGGINRVVHNFVFVAHGSDAAAFIFHDDFDIFHFALRHLVG